MSRAADGCGEAYAARAAGAQAPSGRADDLTLASQALVLARLLARHFGTGARPALLEVGCGAGRLHPYLAGMVGALAGTDQSWTAVARARFDNPGVAYRESVEGEVPWTDASFDVTLAVGTVQRLPGAARLPLLRDMRRATRPGGLVVLIGTNPRPFFARRTLSPDGGAEPLSARAARALLQRVPLIDVGRRHFPVMPAAASARLDAALGALPWGAQYMAWGRA